MSILKRFLAVFSLGYILTFYSEIVFWSRWRPGDSIFSFLITWILYSVTAFFILLMIKYFKVDNAYSVFLVGGVFGWMIEGIISQTVYENFPFQIVWTGLAWHALISVLAGFYLALKALGNWRSIKAITYFMVLGIFWGLWASYWKFEDGYARTVEEFSIYSFSMTLILIISYMIFTRAEANKFRPNRFEIIGFTAIIAYFMFYRAIKTPLSLIIIPLLIGISIYALKRLGGVEDVFNHINNVKSYRLTLVLFIPFSAVITYAIFKDIWIEMNAIIAFTTSIISLIIFLMGIYHAFKYKPKVIT